MLEVTPHLPGYRYLSGVDRLTAYPLSQKMLRSRHREVVAVPVFSHRVVGAGRAAAYRTLPAFWCDGV